MHTSTIVGVLAILMVAICLVPAGAHLAELPNKLALPAAEYMIVQKAYAGWALFGLAILLAVLLTLLHAVIVWRHEGIGGWSLAAFVLLVATQGMFWTFTYPMNALTENWTQTPANFEAARQQWEYSHAASAALTFAALVCIVIGVVAARYFQAAEERSGTAAGGDGTSPSI